MSASAIEWTDMTWNPVTGCDRVSPGCAHCYALELAARLKAMGQKRYQRDGDPRTSGPGFGITAHPDKLEDPLRWTRRRRVFVNSMSDLFHEAVPDDFIAKVFAVMAVAERHTFQVLTKRPERMAALLAADVFKREVGDQIISQGYATAGEGRRIDPDVDLSGWPRPNIWLGVSIENSRFVHRADLLRETPAAVRFISAEPLLGPLVGEVGHGAVGEPRAGGHGGTGRAAATAAGPTSASGQARRHAPLDLTDIDWLIVGGESGPKARPIDSRWVRSLRDACLSQRYGPDGYDDSLIGTRFFFKQWGGPKPTSGGRELDGRTWDEFPTQGLEAAA